MATIRNEQGIAAARPVEVIGTFLPCVALKITPTSAEASANALSVQVHGVAKIEFAMIQVLDSGNNVASSDADVTWSGNTLTIADGSSFNLAATMTIVALIFGPPRA